MYFFRCVLDSGFNVHEFRTSSNMDSSNMDSSNRTPRIRLVEWMFFGVAWNRSSMLAECKTSPRKGLASWLLKLRSSSPPELGLV